MHLHILYYDWPVRLLKSEPGCEMGKSSPSEMESVNFNNFGKMWFGPIAIENPSLYLLHNQMVGSRLTLCMLCGLSCALRVLHES